MTKQLSQEQIDSLNAIYAKQRDPSLILEVADIVENKWLTSTADTISQLELVFGGDTKYRIKPVNKVQKIKTPEVLLPLVGKNTLPVRPYAGSSSFNFKVVCEVYAETEQEAIEWRNFLLSLSDDDKVVTVEE